MSWDDSSERMLPATPLRRRQARQEGHVWRSSDLSAALMTGGAGLLLMWQGPAAVRGLGELLRRSLSRTPILRGDLLTASWDRLPIVKLCGGAIGLLLGLWLLAILFRWLQVGPLLAPGLVQPRAERIAPAAGLRRMFSADTAERGIVWLLRLIVVGLLIGWTLSNEAAVLAGLVLASPAIGMVRLGELLATFALRLSGVLLAVAAVDAAWQWSSHQRRLRMTPEEARAEQQESRRPQTHRHRRHAGPTSSPAESVPGI